VGLFIRHSFPSSFSSFVLEIRHKTEDEEQGDEDDVTSAAQAGFSLVATTCSPILNPSTITVISKQEEVKK
jgi:hypothetical protein